LPRDSAHRSDRFDGDHISRRAAEIGKFERFFPAADADVDDAR